MFKSYARTSERGAHSRMLDGESSFLTRQLSHFCPWSCPLPLPTTAAVRLPCVNSIPPSRSLALDSLELFSLQAHLRVDAPTRLLLSTRCRSSSSSYAENLGLIGFSSNCAEEEPLIGILYSCHFLKGHLPCSNHRNFQGCAWSLVLMADPTEVTDPTVLHLGSSQHCPFPCFQSFVLLVQSLCLCSKVPSGHHGRCSGPV